MKPREWLIKYPPRVTSDLTYANSYDGGETLHVIERSAYDDLESKLAEQKKWLRESDDRRGQLLIELTEAKAMIDKLAAALHGQSECGNCNGCRAEAQEALSDLAKWRAWGDGK